MQKSTSPTSSPIAASKFKLPEPTFSGEPAPTIIPRDVTNLVFVTGFRGAGKTHFLLGIDNPNNILFLDYESKGAGPARSLGIENYFSINDECAGVLGFNFRPISVYERTRQIIEAMPADRFTTLIIDNGAILQDGALAEVQKQPHLYGIDPQKAISGRFGGAWPGVRSVLRSLLSIAREKRVQVIGVSFQLNRAWGDAGPILNKFKTTDVALWHELSVLTAIMVPGLPKNIPIPSALVMKEQLSSTRWDPELQQMETQRRLPMKLPKATMAEVYRYLREPADFKNPRPGETPEPGELEPYSPSFSREQLTIMAKLADAAALAGQVEADDSE